MQEREVKEMVLSLGQFAYVQDTTNGQIKLHAGPAVINQSQQEAPVIYDARDGFVRVNSLLEAVRKSPIAVEGYYLELFNPVKNPPGDNLIGAQPEEGMSGKMAPSLDKGRRINLPGPVDFPLWPGQHANYIKGHQLRSNQYLLIEVYNAEEAAANWKDTIIKDSEGNDVVDKRAPDDLSVGKRLLIKGTDVSFYIPPTGIKVLKDEDDDNYLREALTLERLEYAILVDESGTKRFPTGPEVVFPEPTEIIFKDDRGNRKFTALDLNELQGIHVKVISDYEDDTGTHKIGEELFITGKDTQVYFPREEHALINYDGNKKHYATAISKGDGRYILNRLTGEIAIRRGELMCLPNPIKEVFLKRALTDQQSLLWYPRSKSAQEYNKELRNLLRASPSTRPAGVTDGEVSRRGRARKKREEKGETISSNALYANSEVAAFTSPGSTARGAFAMDSANLGEKVGAGVMADEITRGSTYTQPRSLTMETKFSGVPIINVWPGYAVQVVNKTGERRVLQGPISHLMEFDEELEVLGLSRGKPKNTDNLLETVYLNTAHNKCSDIIEVTTQDHVKVHITVALNVDFTGDPNKWWEIRNYTKYLTDHVRSVLKGAVQKQEIAKFYAGSTDKIRDIILGEKNVESGTRKGLLFEENGMHVSDVDVMNVEIQDQTIRTLLDRVQQQIVAGNIELEHLKHRQQVTEQKETITRKEADTVAKTAAHHAKLELERVARELEGVLAEIAAKAEQSSNQRAMLEAREANTNFEHAENLGREQRRVAQDQEAALAAQNLRVTELKANVQAMVDRYQAVAPGFTQALLTLSEQDNAVKIAKAVSAQTLIGGESVVATIDKVFDGTPLKGIMTKVINGGANGADKQISA